MTGKARTKNAWFDEAFGESYIDLYAHRDDQSARQEIRHVLSQLPAFGLALDLACGEGRHTRALQDYGFSVVSLDRSWPLLREGVKKSSFSAVRGDMRALPFASHQFSLVIQMFTAFGYFPTAAENLQVLSEVERVLKGSGVYLLDYLDARWARQTLQPKTERLLRGGRCLEERSIDGNRLKKRVRWLDPAEQVVRDYEESVMLFEPEELPGLLAERGLKVQAKWGDFQGRAYGEGSRCVLLARKDP